jgi:hypothetical protein
VSISRGLAALAPLTGTGAAMHCGSAIKRILVVDFDGTCTIGDTTPLIPHLATSSRSRLAEFSRLEGIYFQGLRGAQAALGLDAPPCDTYDPEALALALSTLDDVSVQVTEMVSQSGVLAGITHDSVTLKLEKWRAQPDAAPVQPPTLRCGCEETLEGAAASGVLLFCLSVNWCPALLTACLPILGAPETGMYTNLIDSSGYITQLVNGAAAKRDVIEKIKRETSETRPTSQVEVVYVGDSTTDLLALLAADVGILIGDSASTRVMARRYGVAIEPMPAQGGMSPPGTIWEVKDWGEIRQRLGFCWSSQQAISENVPEA